MNERMKIMKKIITETRNQENLYNIIVEYVRRNPTTLNDIDKVFRQLEELYRDDAVMFAWFDSINPYSIEGKNQTHD